MASVPTAVERALVDERPRLVGLAYRITGSRLEAEDVVQDAWMRARRADPDEVREPAAWLTTVVTRLALDHLRASQRRREAYVGPWLAEPVVTGDDDHAPPGAAHGPGPDDDAPAGAGDPAGAVELAESLTFGFLRVLDTLSPVERAVFVLADVFATPFPEIARAVGRSPDACRQVASRARRRVREDGRRHLSPPDAEQVAEDLVTALVSGQVDRVLALLAPDVVLLSDGGAGVHAARRPVVGSERVQRMLVNLTQRGLGVGAVHVERKEVNGMPGVVVHEDDRPVLVVAVSVADSLVTGVYSVLNPDKLAALAVADDML